MSSEPAWIERAKHVWASAVIYTKNDYLRFLYNLEMNNTLIQFDDLMDLKKLVKRKQEKGLFGDNHVELNANASMNAKSVAMYNRFILLITMHLTIFHPRVN